MAHARGHVPEAGEDWSRTHVRLLGETARDRDADLTVTPDRAMLAQVAQATRDEGLLAVESRRPDPDEAMREVGAGGCVSSLVWNPLCHGVDA
ncbi:hypothetical protein OG440_17515 [Streptomyces sp. NBC_00637]|uniref:hypothetical protein n=1 Tax=Streptomyces sp. NBC_00637 TaxID=2903667 RepID=UPI0032431EC8